jgi:hypothetical protein
VVSLIQATRPVLAACFLAVRILWGVIKDAIASVPESHSSMGRVPQRTESLGDDFLIFHDKLLI